MENLLQGNDIKSVSDGRVHCSLNINTETGRLSARRPSLQVLYCLYDNPGYFYLLILIYLIVYHVIGFDGF